MARNLLTALAIKNSTADKMRDGDGLWLHRSKAGAQYWVFIYIRQGKRREMGYPDVPAFIKRVRTVKGNGARALEFTILTAVRSGEARGAVWTEFDLRKKIWTIPAKRMKSGKIHRVPLSPRVIEIVDAMKTIATSDYVFPGSKPKTAMSDMTLTKVLKTLKVEATTVHGFRSSFRDWISEATEFQTEVAEAALAHQTGDAVERAYLCWPQSLWPSCNCRYTSTLSVQT